MTYTSQEQTTKKQAIKESAKSPEKRRKRDSNSPSQEVSQNLSGSSNSSVRQKQITITAKGEKHELSASKVPQKDKEVYFAGFSLPVKIEETGSSREPTNQINERHVIRQYVEDTYMTVDAKGKRKKEGQKRKDDEYGKEVTEVDQEVTKTKISWTDTPGWTSNDASLESPQYIEEYDLKVQWEVIVKNEKGKETKRILTPFQNLKMSMEGVGKEIKYKGFNDYKQTWDIPGEESTGTRSSKRLRKQNPDEPDQS